MVCVQAMLEWGRWQVKGRQRVDEKSEVVWRRLQVVALPEAPPSGLYTVRWRSPPVGRHSSSWGGDECLSSVPQVGYRLRRPKRPNQHWDSVVVVGRVTSLVVVAVEEVWRKRSPEKLLAYVVLA